jgi:HPt (histidine-containing phosphotransfer) domain-containing protein
MTTNKQEAVVVKHSDHEVITPVHKLRKATTYKPPMPGQEDSVACAEEALAQLSGQFASWMGSECERLDEARKAVETQGFNDATRDELFRAAHDIKGEAATFGFPAVAPAAQSLCRLIEFSPEMTRIPFALVAQHVDAMRAIYREYNNPDVSELADALTARLRHVTDDFLLRENHDRPEVLEQIGAPSVVPDKGA